MEKIRFECPYCSERFDDLQDLKAHVVDMHESESLPAPDGVIKLTVNGEIHEIKVEPHWTLYQVIHDKLGFTGAKMFLRPRGLRLMHGNHGRPPDTFLHDTGDRMRRKENRNC